MAGCRMAAKGKTLANVGYDTELKSIQAFLSMQHPASQPVINPLTLDIQIEDYVAQRFLRKPKSKVILVQILLIYLYQHLLVHQLLNKVDADDVFKEPTLSSHSRTCYNF